MTDPGTALAAERRRTVERLTAELAGGRPDAWHDVAHEEFRHHVRLPGLPAGLAGAMALSERLTAALEEVRVTHALVVHEGHHLVQRSTVTARHRRTGRRVDWVEHHAFEFDSGDRIVSWRPALRLHRLLAVLDGRPEPPHRPGHHRGSGLAAGALRLASLAAPPLGHDDREVVRAYVERFKNQQQLRVFPRVFGPGFRHHFDYDGDAGDLRSWVRTGQDFLRAVPDVTVELHALIADGPLVAEVNTARGTYTGPFRGTSPTGRPVEWDEIHLYRLAGGRIVENWPAVDAEGALGDLATADDSE